MDIGTFYLRYEYALAAVQLFFAMLGMGATLAPRDFLTVVRDPRGAVLGLLLQVVGAPLIAWGFINGLALDPGLAMGLALCAAIPGGAMSNVLTYFARGHVALSIVLTATSTLACLLTTPLVLGLLTGEHLSTDFEMPAARIAIEIGMFLLGPLMLGMLVLRFWPRGARRFAHAGIRISVLTVVVIVIGAFGSGRLDQEAFGERNMLIVMLFVLALSVFSALLPRLLRLSAADTAAINIEVSVRSTNLALLIKASLFPAVVGVSDPVGDNVLFTVLLYGGLSLVVGPALLLGYRLALRPIAAPVTLRT